MSRAAGSLAAAAGRVRRVIDNASDSPVGPLIRAARRYMDDGMMERAPALAYYGILSLFPSLLFAFTVVRFIGGDSAPEDLAAYAREHGVSGEVATALRSAADTARNAEAPTAGAAGALGLLTLVYGASKAFTATGRAIDAIGGRPRAGRSLLRRAKDVGWTVLLLVLSVVALVLLSVSGDLLKDLLGLFGLTGGAVTAWSIARLPVAAALLLFIVALVYWAAPSKRETAFRPLTHGAAVAVTVLLVATLGYNVYISDFASYNATYGTSAGLIILLLWFWLAGSAILYGAEIDAVIEEPTQERA
jgi:membrane protein